MATIVIDHKTLPDTVSERFGASRIAAAQQPGGNVPWPFAVDPADYDNDTDYLNAIPGMAESIIKSMNAPMSEFEDIPRNLNSSNNKETERHTNTVVIGGKTWMAENLNYQTSSGSWCYMSYSSTCDKYGRLYDWNTARTVCPTGFHLPSRQEWENLMMAVGGKNTAGKKLLPTTFST